MAVNLSPEARARGMRWVVGLLALTVSGTVLHFSSQSAVADEAGLITASRAEAATYRQVDGVPVGGAKPKSSLEASVPPAKPTQRLIAATAEELATYSRVSGIPAACLVMFRSMADREWFMVSREIKSKSCAMYGYGTDLVVMRSGRAAKAATASWYYRFGGQDCSSILVAMRVNGANPTAIEDFVWSQYFHFGDSPLECSPPTADCTDGEDSQVWICGPGDVASGARSRFEVRTALSGPLRIRIENTPIANLTNDALRFTPVAASHNGQVLPVRCETRPRNTCEIKLTLPASNDPAVISIQVTLRARVEANPPIEHTSLNVTVFRGNDKRAAASAGWGIGVADKIRWDVNRSGFFSDTVTVRTDNGLQAQMLAFKLPGPGICGTVKVRFRTTKANLMNVSASIMNSAANEYGFVSLDGSKITKNFVLSMKICQKQWRPPGFPRQMLGINPNTRYLFYVTASGPWQPGGAIQSSGAAIFRTGWGQPTKP